MLSDAQDPIEISGFTAGFTLNLSRFTSALPGPFSFSCKLHPTQLKPFSKLTRCCSPTPSCCP